MNYIEQFQSNNAMCKLTVSSPAVNLLRIVHENIQ